MTAVQRKLALVDPEAPGRIVAKNHWYQLDNGPLMPGVTSILRIQDALGGSDGLIRWAVNLAAKAAFDEARASENPDFNRALELAIEATEEPRNRGSRVHDGIDAQVSDFAHVPTQRDGAIWYHWSRFLLREKPEIIATEQYIVGDGFGGTFDFDAVIKGKRSLVDVKSGKYKDSFALQLAAYSSGQWMAPKSTGSPVTPVPRFEAFYVLMLSDDGYQLLEQEVGPAEIEHFRFLVKTHQILHAWNKRSKEKAA